VYFATLSVAVIVSVIGISAVLAVRVQRRTFEITNDAVKARFHAQSAMEMGMYKLHMNSNWRYTYTNDIWTPYLDIEQGTYRFKLVDEIDGNLGNDPTQPVRLYAQAKVGQADRIYSVQLEPVIPENMLLNGNMENGTTNWSGMGLCDLDWYTDDPHTGIGYMWVKNRISNFAGPFQDITDKITNGQTYKVEVWVKMKSFSETVYAVIYMETSMGAREEYFPVSSVGLTWRKLSGTLRPSWFGTLNKAYFKIDTYSSIQEFMVDDALLIPQRTSDEPGMVTVPGTWRREINP